MSEEINDWDVVMQPVGGAPAGFREFIAASGATCIGGFLWVLSPFADNPHLNLIQQTQLLRESLHELAAAHDAFCPPRFIDADSLVCCGITDNGDHLCWLPKPDGGHFYIFLESRAPEFFEVNDVPDFQHLLADLLSRRLRCPHWPDSFPSLGK